AIALAAGLAIVGAPRWGDPGAAARALAADRRAAAGDVETARTTWLALWREGSRAPGLAARLSWVALRDGDTAGAAAWALRGGRGARRGAGGRGAGRPRPRGGGGVVRRGGRPRGPGRAGAAPRPARPARGARGGSSWWGAFGPRGVGLVTRGVAFHRFPAGA